MKVAYRAPIKYSGILKVCDEPPLLVLAILTGLIEEANPSGVEFINGA
jgi:hypothetical protein